jgi:hypothetical protein
VSFGALAQRLPGAIELLPDRVEPLAVLLLAALLRLLQELVLLADQSFDVRVDLEVARNRGEVLVVLARDLLVWVEARDGGILWPRLPAFGSPG